MRHSDHRSNPRRRPADVIRRAAVVVIAISMLTSCREQPEPTLVDDLGRNVVLPRTVSRVVTLAPNLTEIVYAVGAGEKLVGADQHSDHPEEARSLPKVGGMQPDVEKIAALDPDVVLASTEGNHPNLAPVLAAAGIPLYVVRTDRLAQITTAMQRVGELLGAPRTEDAVAELERALAAERRERPKAPRILFAVWTDPLYVAGRETFTDDVFSLTGSQNAVTIAGWPQYSLESLASAPPDIILHPRGSVTHAQVAALLERIDVSPDIIAVEGDVFQRPGPRVARAAHELNSILDRWRTPKQ